jgi:hypothetical protein
VVVHVCNPKYAGGKDWEDQSMRPTLAKRETLFQPIGQTWWSHL